MVDRKNNKMIDKSLSVAHHLYCLYQNDKMTTTEKINDITEKHAELIDGKIYYMAPSSWKHQRSSGKLYQSIANYIDNKGGTCEVLAAPFAVFLNDIGIYEGFSICVQ